MVVLSNPGTYSTRKCSSWCADIHKSKDPEYKHPEIQQSKNLKIQESKNPKLFRRCEKFWIFGFLGFWIFVFYTCVPICGNSSKTGFGKKWRLHRYLLCFGGCACRWGGDHIFNKNTHTCVSFELYFAHWNGGPT